MRRGLAELLLERGAGTGRPEGRERVTTECAAPEHVADAIACLDTPRRLTVDIVTD